MVEDFSAEVVEFFFCLLGGLELVKLYFVHKFVICESLFIKEEVSGLHH
jgi:hypothetical protein